MHGGKRKKNIYLGQNNTHITRDFSTSRRDIQNESERERKGKMFTRCVRQQRLERKLRHQKNYFFKKKEEKKKLFFDSPRKR